MSTPRDQELTEARMEFDAFMKGLREKYGMTDDEAIFVVGDHVWYREKVKAFLARQKALEAEPNKIVFKPINEHVARLMYDDYCKAVGGKAFNDEPLPGSEEFFADESKSKQALAWIVAADTAIDAIDAIPAPHG